MEAYRRQASIFDVTSFPNVVWTLNCCDALVPLPPYCAACGSRNISILKNVIARNTKNGALNDWYQFEFNCFHGHWQRPRSREHAASVAILRCLVHACVMVGKKLDPFGMNVPPPHDPRRPAASTTGGAAN